MKSPITVTDAARQQLDILFAQFTQKVLRVSVGNKGCSGHNYDFDWVDESDLGKFDEILDFTSGKLAIQANSILKLLGSELDYETTQFESKFVWKNPLVKNTCGCGKSVGF